MSFDASQLTKDLNLQKDLTAALTGAVAAIPQAMAFALIAGISPIYGLYAAVVGTIVAGITMNSRLMTVGPTNALALAVASTLATHAGADELQTLVTLTVLVGVFQLGVGLLKMGRLTRFVSNAVMTGFISGAGVLIILGQLSNLTGVDSQGRNPVLTFVDWITHLPQIDWRTSLIGLGAIALLFALRQTRLKDASLLLMFIASLGVVQLFGWQDVAVVADISPIPAELPTPLLPEFTLVTELIIPAVAIGILGLVQSAGVAQSLREAEDISRDFIGQGLANIGSGLLRGMPVGGSISRTAVNIQAGATSRWANIISGVIIGISMIVFAPIIEEIPLAALAALLVVSAIRLIDIGDILTVWRTYMPERIAMTVTFLATLVLPLEYSIYAGVVISMLLYLETASKTAKLVRLLPEGETFREVEPSEHLPNGETVILGLYGDPYFGAVALLKEQLPNVNGAEGTNVILRMRGLNVVGSTFIVLLRDYAEELDEGGGNLLLTGVSDRLVKELRNAELHNLIGEDEVFSSDETILSSTKKAVKKVNDDNQQGSEGPHHNNQGDSHKGNNNGEG